MAPSAPRGATYAWRERRKIPLHRDRRKTELHSDRYQDRPALTPRSAGCSATVGRFDRARQPLRCGGTQISPRSRLLATHCSTCPLLLVLRARSGRRQIFCSDQNRTTELVPPRWPRADRVEAIGDCFGTRTRIGMLRFDSIGIRVDLAETKCRRSCHWALLLRDGTASPTGPHRWLFSRFDSLRHTRNAPAKSFQGAHFRRDFGETMLGVHASTLIASPSPAGRTTLAGGSVAVQDGEKQARHTRAINVPPPASRNSG